MVKKSGATAKAKASSKSSKRTSEAAQLGAVGDGLDQPNKKMQKELCTCACCGASSKDSWE